MILLQKLKRIPNKLIVLIIKTYRLLISPSVGLLGKIGILKPSCIFYPTCSEYALICFEKYSFWEATKKTINRVLRCNSHNTPSVDLP